MAIIHFQSGKASSVRKKHKAKLEKDKEINKGFWKEMQKIDKRYNLL